MRVGSLFAGIGGFDLGLERAGFTIEWQCEIDPWCQRVLAKHWPHVKRYGDITAIDWATVPTVDVLCGGFPCQDISLAGKGAGLAGARSGLWSEYAKAIQALQPQWVIIENVSALRSRGLDQVLGTLASFRYDAEWHCIPACAVGAPHQRDRVWVIAYPQSCRQQSPVLHRWEGSEVYAPDSHEWPTRNNMGREVHGIPHRVDRLRGLGNAVVPQIVEHIGRSIRHAQQQLQERQGAGI